jgi:hypothetical protein
MKTQYGDEAEMLVEEILRQGQDTASSVIIRAATRLKDTLKGNASYFCKLKLCYRIDIAVFIGLMLFI